MRKSSIWASGIVSKIGLSQKPCSTKLTMSKSVERGTLSITLFVGLQHKELFTFEVEWSGAIQSSYDLNANWFKAADPKLFVLTYPQAEK